MNPCQPDLQPSDRERSVVRARLLEKLFLVQLKTLRNGSAIAQELGLPGTCEANAGATWLGPREWLLVRFSPDEHEQLVDYLDRQRRDGRAAYSDMSNALLMFELSCGPALVTMLTGLPEAALAPGRAACTRFGHVKTLFANRPDGTLWMTFAREYERHMLEWLRQAV